MSFLDDMVGSIEDDGPKVARQYLVVPQPCRSSAELTARAAHAAKIRLPLPFIGETGELDNPDAFPGMTAGAAIQWVLRQREAIT